MCGYLGRFTSESEDVFDEHSHVDARGAGSVLSRYWFRTLTELSWSCSVHCTHSEFVSLLRYQTGYLQYSHLQISHKLWSNTS